MWDFLSASDEWRNEFGELREYWQKNLCLPNPWAGKEFAEDFSKLQLAKGLLFI